MWGGGGGRWGGGGGGGKGYLKNLGLRGGAIVKICHEEGVGGGGVSLEQSLMYTRSALPEQLGATQSCFGNFGWFIFALVMTKVNEPTQSTKKYSVLIKVLLPKKNGEKIRIQTNKENQMIS